MSNVDEKIANIDGNICKNIDKNKDDRGFLSQNILKMKEKYNFNILHNLDDFPLKVNGAEQEYYEKISKLFKQRAINFA